MIELEPMGVTTQASISQPFLLFREKEGNAVVPVEIHPIDAAVAIAEMDQEMVSPHDIALDILQDAGLNLSRVVFLDGDGKSGFLELRFSDKKFKPLRFPTEFAMSFCLRSKARFFCSRRFLDSCRELHIDVAARTGELEQMQRPRYLN
jgi:hypothetical protein